MLQALDNFSHFVATHWLNSRTEASTAEKLSERGGDCILIFIYMS